MPASRPDLALLPRPSRISSLGGRLTLDRSTTVRALPGAEPAADLLRSLVGPPTGLPLAPSPEGRIVLVLDDGLGGLGEEGYGLTVGPQALRLRAARPAGLLRGVQTIRQLLPAEALSGGAPGPGPWELPCVEITDVPDRPWRGALLDVARHFLPIGYLHRYVDLLALHKLNVLHLHLTDDQGWRMPVDAYPRLTTVGARRARSQKGPAVRRGPSSTPYRMKGPTPRPSCGGSCGTRRSAGSPSCRRSRCPAMCGPRSPPTRSWATVRSGGWRCGTAGASATRSSGCTRRCSPSAGRCWRR